MITFSTIDIFSRSSSGDALQDQDTSNAVEKESPHNLYSITGYGSNMIYMGSTISGNQPYVYSAMTYGFHNDLYATISGFHLSETEPFVAFYSGSISYNHTFTSWFDISAGIYRYQFSKVFADTLFSNFTYYDFTAGFDWNLLYTQISAGGIFSMENQKYLQIMNSRYFQTGSFLKDKASFSFDPYINILFGPLIKAETINTSTTVTTTQQYYSPWSGSITNTGNTASGSGNGNGSGYGSGSGSSSSGTTNTATTTTSIPVTNTFYTNTFNLIQIEFGLPVSFNINKLTVEAELNYTLPGYKDDLFPAPKGFIFLLSGYFRIF